MGAFVIEGDPLGIGFIEPEDEVKVEERERGWEVRIEVFYERDRVPVVSP